MKKLFFAAAVAALTFTGVNAQEVKFGAKAGLNLSNLTGDEIGESGDTKTRTAFHVGGVAEISFSEKFSVQPELVYSLQGATEEIGDVDVTYQFDYLNIPVIAKYYVAEGLSLEAGPQIGFLTSAKIKAELEDEEEEEDIKEYFKGTNFGLGFGLGYKLENGLNFAARYNLGLSNIAEEDDDFELKTNTIQISVGFMF